MTLITRTSNDMSRDLMTAMISVRTVSVSVHESYICKIPVNSDLQAGELTKITTSINAVIFQQHHVGNR
ncbi:hypothetical protein L2E82_40448 [Cichorium intybus]|uniref:Uncharacterized protein n=1 Tax=Cichorium intybus TaxID=13427 RepID=A0ACB9AKT4_CICIN|nr:hypothetical protein L2E82_40448 [Cichorium intybus]